MFLQAFSKTGYFQSALILETFAEHFSSSGVNMDPTLMEIPPIGALSLTLSAVSSTGHGNTLVLMSFLIRSNAHCVPSKLES